MSRELICGAIQQRRIITFVYKNALRTVEPHIAVGNTKGHSRYQVIIVAVIAN